MVIIQHQAEAFDKFGSNDKKLMKWIGPSVHILYTISATFGEGVGMVHIRKLFAMTYSAFSHRSAGASFCECGLYRDWRPSRRSFIRVPSVDDINFDI
jgi:hypothetical protein